MDSSLARVRSMVRRYFVLVAEKVDMYLPLATQTDLRIYAEKVSIIMLLVEMYVSWLSQVSRKDFVANFNKKWSQNLFV